MKLQPLSLNLTPEFIQRSAQQMKRLLLLLPMLLLRSTAQAHVKDDIHAKHLKAADYAGCVQVNSSIAEVDGNTCPPRFAYVGDKTCRGVECRITNYRSPLLAGRTSHS